MKSIDSSVLSLRTSLAVVGICLANLIFGTTNVSAGIYNWGDLNDPGSSVVFLDVEEANGYGTSLYAPEPGLGSPYTVGNTLVLDPQNFLSQSSYGSNLTDSQLSTTLMVDSGNSISSFVVNEFGDHTLGGLAGGTATAQVGASFYWQILEINGLPVNMPIQTDTLQVTTGSGPNGGIYNRPDDDSLVTPWEGSVMIDVAGYLSANLIAGNATKVDLIFDNVLLTAADEFSSAFIKKKGIEIDVYAGNPFSVVPEPASIFLLGMGLCLLRRPRNRVR